MVSDVVMKFHWPWSDLHGGTFTCLYDEANNFRVGQDRSAEMDDKQLLTEKGRSDRTNHYGQCTFQ